jgi:glycosyltransferase involved in cell wall biosynthesis
MKSAFAIGLVISLYNQPECLKKVLAAVARQTSRPDEVLFADDGSGDDTEQLINRWGEGFPNRCQHFWQENKGFRKARILNKAIASAKSDYLVFLDGDTIPHPEFVRDHRQLAGAQTYVQGHRCLISQSGANAFGRGQFNQDRTRALVRGQLRRLTNAFRWPWPLKRLRTDTRGVRGCNIGIWRNDLVAVNGFNEAFAGWGREDSELIIRLFNLGIRRVDVRGWALCFHLWHPPASRENVSRNDQLAFQAQATKLVRCAQGLDQCMERPGDDE